MKIKKFSELESIVLDARKNAHKIIFTTGVFDILHIGHVKCLKESKKFGDILIVAINSDNSVKKLKGENRPINPEQYRAEIIAELECVNYVTIFYEDNVKNLLKRIKPEIFVKGGDYNLKTINQSERQIVESYGGQIYFTQEVDNYSTTKLIESLSNKNEKTKNSLSL